MKWVSRLFEKKYRVESRKFGRGTEEWTHRTLALAALQAVHFDRVEAFAGGDDVWIVKSKYRKWWRK